MQFHEFLGQVQNRAHLSSLADAEIAVRATLTTLAERLAGGEPKDLASQLPEPLGQYLVWEGADEPQRLSLNEFFQRVSERTNADLPKALHQARVVMQVLSEAITPGELDDIRAQLPEEFQTLFAK